MKILRHGNVQPSVKFTCWNCECEFIADCKEYENRKVYDLISYYCECPEDDLTSYSCKCPDCGVPVDAGVESEVNSDED